MDDSDVRWLFNMGSGGKIPYTMAGMVNGIPLYENAGMTVAGDPVYTKRSWVDRLFSFPWRPLRSHNCHVPMLPDPKVVCVGKGAFGGPSFIVGHPETIRAFLEAINRAK